ncbi:MAG: DUF4157 domain-containing protein [Nibricoccus sp.]
MANRSFNPVLTRRAAPAPKTAARPVAQTRVTGAAAGTPRFAASLPKPVGISQRNDRWENEARRVSSSVRHFSPATQHGPAPFVPSSATPVATDTARAKPLHRPPGARSIATRAASANTFHAVPKVYPGFSPATSFPTANGPPVHDITPTAPLGGSSGSPLNPVIRQRLESVLGVKLSSVRVHTGPVADQAAAQYEARAFTVGSNIYLRSGESPADLELISHETAHAVQQSATLHAASPRGPPSSGSHSISRAPLGMVQRWETPGWLKATGSAIAHPIDTAGKVVDAGAGLIAEGFWAVVDKLAPQKIRELLHDIKDHGFIGVLKTKVSAALDFVFSSLKAQGGTAAKIATVFETLIAKAKPILAALAAGDCKPLFAAVKSLGDILGKMAGDAWDKITTFLKPVGDWLSNVWNKFGAPVVDFLKEFAADTWDWIKNVGQELWDLTKPVRDFYSGAWTEIKNLLGFGEGTDDDGSGGLVGWIKEKAGEVWDGIKTELKPIIDPIKNAATAIVDFLPIQDILNLREKITEWMDKATAMADNMDAPDDLAENKDLLHDIILPGIKRAIVKLRGKVVEASTWATTKIGGIVTKVTDFFTTLSGNTLLSPLKGVIQWLSDEAVKIGTWATEKVAGLFASADLALVTLDLWIEPIVNALGKLISALGDLMGRLGDLILGPLLLVPKCIRDPIKDFIVTKILSQIPVFAQLVELPAIWAKVSPAFRAAIVAVFQDGNLFRAAWIFFRTVLDLLGVPPQLVTNLIRNAAKAIKDVLKDPIGFLGNVLEAMKLGLQQFIDNIGKHLLKGAVDWLLSGVKGPGIKIADPFVINLKNVLDLVLQVLDLTMEKIFQRIEKKKGKDVADKCRKIVKVVDKALEWISVLINEGPSGLWKHVQKELSNLWDTMLGMVIDYLIGKIVQQATIWVTKTLASGGLSVIIDAIKAVYDALQVVAQYLKQMLEVANSVCEGIIDIAKGVLTKGANMVENAAARLIPMVLAFLARTLGIGDLPVVIGEGIQKVRKKVEDAIDTLIDKTFALIDWAKQKGKDAVDKLLNWWKVSEDIKADDGTTHHAKLEGEPPAPVKLVIASEPMDGAAAIKAIDKNEDLTDAEKTTFKAQATTKKDAIEASVKKLEGMKNVESAGNKPSDKSLRDKALSDETDKLRGYVRELASILEKSLFSTVPWSEIPDTKPSPAYGSGAASSMKADPLTNLGDGGSEPESGHEPKGWFELQEAGFTEGGYRYKQMHLVNARFGGKGVRNNLTPGSHQNNSDHLGSVENPLKELVGNARGDRTKKGYLWYSVKVNYGAANRGPKWPDSFISKKTGQPVRLKGVLSKADFAESIQCEWGVYKRTNKKWTKQTSAIGSFSVGPIPLPPFETV